MIDPKYLEGLDIETTLQILFIWSSRQRVPTTSLGPFPDVVARWEELKNHKVIEVEESWDEQTRIKGPFVLSQRLLEPEERISFVVTVYMPAVRSALLPGHDSERPLVLGSFSGMVILTMTLYERLKALGVQFGKA